MDKQLAMETKKMVYGKANTVWQVFERGGKVMAHQIKNSANGFTSYSKPIGPFASINDAKKATGAKKFH